MTRTSLDAPPPARGARVRTAFAMLLVATLATGAAGCTSNDASTAPAVVNAPGEYELQTIQAKPVPAKVYDGPWGTRGTAMCSGSTPSP